MAKKKKGTERAFRVVAVPYQKDFRKFAAELEKQLNALLDNGYQVSTETHPRGIVIMAHLIERRADPHPFDQLLRGMREQALGDFPHLSADVRALIVKVIQLVDLSRPDTFKEAVRKTTEELIKGLDNETLRRFTKELEEEVRTHHDHCTNTECTASKIVFELAESIKQHIQMNLQ